MARAIDAGAVKRRAWDIAEAWKDQGRDYEALLLESVVEQIVDTQPTLTPPNEPLTWNELGNMIEKPVYIVELEDGESCWVLVHTVDDIKALFVSAFDQYDYGNRELYGQTWLVYRRPPEGEADD